MNKHTPKLDLKILDIILLLICYISIFSIVLLVIGVFKPLYVLILSFILLFSTLKVFNIHIIIHDDRLGWKIAFILIIALVLRLKPYLYVMGGQDQGTYVNMSRQFELQGSLYTTDHFRNTLTDEQKEMYDVHGKYLMPEFQEWDHQKSAQIMKLYPMHPAWMAIFSFLLGADNRVYSLTFFSLLSILGFFLVALAITRKKGVAVLVAMFLTISPIHVFFAKFPVTETVALAFTSFGIYYLISYIRGTDTEVQAPWKLILSVLLFNAFFYTRLSSFMYIPLFLGTGFLFSIVIKDTVVKRNLKYYVASVLILVLISYIVHFKFLYPLFYEIYLGYLKQFLGEYSTRKIIGVFGLLIILSFLFDIVAKKKVVQKMVATLHKYLWVFYLCFLIVLAFTTYRQYNMLVYSDDYVLSNLFYRWEVAGQGLDSLRHITLYGIITHLSPFGFILLIIASFYELFKKKKDIYINSFIVYVWYFIALNSYFTFIFIYNYYSSRYFLSEIVPFAYLIIAVFLTKIWGKHKIVTTLLACGILLYNMYFLPLPVLENEMPNLDFYEKIQEKVKSDSLLLVNKNFRFGNAAVSPLKYYYDYDVFPFYYNEDINTKEIEELSKKYNHVYLLTATDDKMYAYTPNKDTLRFRYDYFNTPGGCTQHSYSYLPIEKSVKLPFSDYIGCWFLPSVKYTGYSDLYLYTLK